MGIVLLGEALTLALGAAALVGLEESCVYEGSAEALSQARRLHQHGDMMHDGLRAAVYEGAYAAAVAAPDEERERIVVEATRLATAFRGDIDGISKLDVDPRAATALAEVRPTLEAYIDASLQILARSAARGEVDPEGLVAFQARFEDAGDAQAHVLDTLVAVELDEERQMASARRRSALLVGSLAALSFVALLGLAWRVSRSVGAALHSLGSVADRVVAGDLKARVDADLDGDTAELATRFNRMADALTSVVDRLAYDAQRDGLGRQLNEALDMADDERDVADVVQRTLVEAAPDRPTELLLADSSAASLERFAESPTAGAPGCPSRSPFDCPAVRKGSTMVAPASTALNACPHLRNRASGPCSAVCVPVSFMGRALGVLHSTGPVASDVAPEVVTKLVTLATQAGARIGTVRAFQQTQLQASTDGLTGLVNRRTFENELRRVLATGDVVAVAMADLDKFKLLNDTAGHDAGDRALRHFARVLRRTTRSTDLVARYGGEEFALAFIGLDREAASVLLDRIRVALAASHRGDVPAFTCSFGVTDSSFGSDVAELVAVADDALYAAKRGGRDRVALGPTPGARPPTKRASLTPAAVGDSFRPGAGSRPPLRLASNAPPPVGGEVEPIAGRAP